ncbi:MAG TPA: chemotaxis protein CheD [Clostridiales bacterium]|nr:chemotaxis protein CheD [Clostridiales bacterium]
MSKIIKVGIADMKVAKNPHLLTTLGLGSCVGIALYDRENKIGGLAHIMLPYSNEFKNNSNPLKFADTAVEKLLYKMKEAGSNIEKLTGKIAGGARMFNFKNGGNDILRIGDRNVLAAKEVLKSFDIPLISEDTGGTYGRSIVFHLDDGKVVIKTVGRGIKTI